MGSCPIFVSLLPSVYGLINNILGKKNPVSNLIQGRLLNNYSILLLAFE